VFVGLCWRILDELGRSLGLDDGARTVGRRR
jgi:hypothetical protein